MVSYKIWVEKSIGGGFRTIGATLKAEKTKKVIFHFYEAKNGHFHDNF